MALDGVGVPQFVQHLDNDQRHAIRGQALQGEGVEQIGVENIPLLNQLGHAQGQSAQAEPAKWGREEDLGDAQGSLKPAVRANQWKPEKQVVVYQPLPPTALRGLLALGHFLDALGTVHAQQLLFGQKLQGVLQVGQLHLQWRVSLDGRHDGGAVVQMPAAEDFKGEPVDPVELLAHRVLQDPAGLSVGQFGAFEQVELFAQ